MNLGGTDLQILFHFIDYALDSKCFFTQVQICENGEMGKLYKKLFAIDNMN